MFDVSVISDFSSAHNLRHYKGKCENVHGHNWKVELTASCAVLNEQGMVADFKELKEKLKVILEELDHKNLNDIEYFKKLNPTSENIAKYIYDKFKMHSKISRVKVWESDTSYATYKE